MDGEQSEIAPDLRVSNVSEPNARGVCIKGGSTYRRFRVKRPDGRWGDQYVKLPHLDDPRFASELERINKKVLGPDEVERWSAARDAATLPTGPLVYFFQSIPGFVKIGVTTDVRRRGRELNHASPIPIRLLACVPGGDLALERSYHQRFKQWHARGEWFWHSPEIAAEIERLNA